jgi:predicted nucleic acid-binding protein
MRLTTDSLAGVQTGPPRAVLIDWSAWAEALGIGGDEAYRSAVDTLLAEGHAVTCEPIMARVLQAAMDPRGLAELAEDLGAVTCLGMEGVGRVAGECALELRKRGLHLSPDDLLTLAAARLHGLPLLHRDERLTEAVTALGIERVEV